MKYFNIFVAALFSLSLSSAANAQWQAAADQVDISIKKMLEQATPYRGDAESDLSGLYAELDRILSPNVDFPYISKVVMGKYYRKASSEDKSKFVETFKHTLIKTYGKTLVKFDIDSYSFIKPRKASPQPDKQKVSVEVKSTKGQKYIISNYMVLKEGEWKLVNAVLDGFNLRVTFKNQFAKMAQDSKRDISAVVANWSKAID
ncbi:MAG: MlaC/ttg2D family ABC transporter substrate-binding protein [Pseudomonadales bacterium]